MRLPILICAALALTACGSKNNADNSALAEQNAATEAVVTNDVTAIDAATGEAAEMAPDVNYTLNEANLESGSKTSNTAVGQKPTRKTPRITAAKTTPSETSPAENSL